MADQIPFTTGDIIIAKYDWTTSEYLTPVRLNGEGFAFGAKHAKDKRMYKGMNYRGLSVVEGYEPKLSVALYSEAVKAILYGQTFTSNKADMPMGTNMPYWGIILQLLSDLGGDVHVGFPLNQANTYHYDKVDTNKLASNDLEWTAYVLEKADYSLVKPIIKTNTTPTALPTAIADFHTFFGVTYTP